ncbi:MAG: hypothetical protein R2879_16360 [Saprospiraceae bacterium]
MCKGSFLLLSSIFFISSGPILFAQSDSIPNFGGDLTPMSSQIAVNDQTLINILMPIMPGLGATGKTLIEEQSVKPYMMPPRQVGPNGVPTAYLLASLLEFYVNFDQNFKDNLSPDYISLNNKSGALEDAFLFLANTGTVSAAIMPYNSPSISSAVFATRKYKIKHFLHIFGSISKPRQKIFEVRKALTRGNPVFVNLSVDNIFVNARGKKVWEPEDQNVGMDIPVLVVGFDQENEMFEILPGVGIGYQWLHLCSL